MDPVDRETDREDVFVGLGKKRERFLEIGPVKFHSRNKTSPALSFPTPSRAYSSGRFRDVCL